jgi:uncharacterized RDD family membrane protein YckC
MQTEVEWPLASFPRRVAAAVIDAMILVVPYALLSMVHFALAWLAVPLYGAVMEGSARRATFGKRLCGLEVHPAGGKRITLVGALVRNAVKYAGPLLVAPTYGLSLVVVAAPAVRSRLRQGLHDLAAGSVVRHAPGRGLSQISVGVLATVVPVLFIAGVLPILMNPSYEDASRKEVTRAIEASHPYRMRTAEFYAKNGRLPETLDEIGLAPLSPSIAGFSYRQGRMTLELPQRGSRERALLSFTPEPKGAELAWRCTAFGMRKERVPAICREE